MGHSVGDSLRALGSPLPAVAISSRRQFLIHAGRASLAVAVLGVSACTSGPADEPDDPTGEKSEGSFQNPEASLWWERVDLGSVSAYVLLRGNKAAVVDTGNPGSVDAIGEALRSAGADWDVVTDIVLTHNHPDHAGSLTEVALRAPKATVHVGEADSADLAGNVSVANDGDDIFGLRVIATPGHTLGHISVYDEQLRVLVAGDALTNTAGLAGSNPQYTVDLEMATESVRKLAELPVETVLFGHGYPLRRRVQASLKELAATL